MQLIKYNMSTMTAIKICTLFFKRYKYGIYFDRFRQTVKQNLEMSYLNNKYYSTNFTTSFNALAISLKIRNTRQITSEYYRFIKDNFTDLSKQEIQALNKCIINYPIIKP